MRTSSIILTFLTSLSLVSCGTSTITVVSPDGTQKRVIDVEVANTEREREEGLMKRTELKKHSGMLFVFETPIITSFWMKDTLIPLDLLFFSEDGYFSSAYDAIPPCKKAECPTYKSIELTKYALEMNAGDRKSLGIGVGWKLDLSSLPRAAR